MQNRRLGRDFNRLQAYHTDRVLRLAAAAGKVGIVWQEAADGGADLPQNAVVQVWKWRRDLGPREPNGAANRSAAAGAERSHLAVGGAAPAGGAAAAARRRRALHEAASFPADSGREDPGAGATEEGYWLKELERITAGGHRALLSAPWYLTLAQPQEDAWARLWRVEPLAFGGGEAQRERVIGGEACAWGELVDATNSVSKTWPLAAAVAERLWSDAGVKDEADAEERLREHICRLRARGVAASPLGPGFCPQDLE